MILAHGLLAGDSLSQEVGSFPNRTLVSSAMKPLPVGRRRTFPPSNLVRLTRPDLDRAEENPCENHCGVILKKSGLSWFFL